MSTTRLVFGFAIMTAGVLFTLDNLGLLEADRILRYWPVALILIGLLKLARTSPFGPGGLTALLWIAGGGVLLADVMGYVEIQDLIPALLVLLGARIVWGAVTHRAPRRGARDQERSDDVVQAVAFMGAVGRTSGSQTFRGGDMTAVMGGLELDLRKAAIADGEAVIDTFAFWGGIEIRVPEEWQVVAEGFALMGGFEDSTRGAAGAQQRLIVKGLAVMGGVEIKN